MSLTRSKRSTGLAIATPSDSGLSEFYFGGAGDSVSRLVQSFAQARAHFMQRHRLTVRYFTHFEGAAARRLAERDASEGQRLVFIGHSWGASTALDVAARLSADIDLLVGVDPVGKPGQRFARRPANIRQLIHVDAIPAQFDHSDFVKSLGRIAGGVPQPFLEADVDIRTRHNHANFIGMLRTEGEDGQTALDWMRAHVPKII